MGFSVTLSHIIMVIASVCLASAFSAYAFYSGNLVQNELAQNVNNYKITVNIRLEIVYATVDNTTTPPHFVIYAKNTGNLPVSDFTFLDVYVGTAFGSRGRQRLSGLIQPALWKASSSRLNLFLQRG
jgi:archaellum component FlaF (FlaF/FlaG flagellin family)